MIHLIQVEHGLRVASSGCLLQIAETLRQILFAETSASFSSLAGGRHGVIGIVVLEQTMVVCEAEEVACGDVAQSRRAFDEAEPFDPILGDVVETLVVNLGEKRTTDVRSPGCRSHPHCSPCLPPRRSRWLG